MLRWISIFEGLLIMMGQHARSEALFYLCLTTISNGHRAHAATTRIRCRCSIVRTRGVRGANRRATGMRSARFRREISLRFWGAEELLVPSGGVAFVAVVQSTNLTQ